MTSTTGKTPMPMALPLLPSELYRNIIDSLDYLRERRTLLCLALVSNAWCVESQRVLFRTVCDDSTDLNERECLIHAHTLFLKAIILNPSRLGSYVQIYRQRELICHPSLATSLDARSPITSTSLYLWDLTAQALPALVNLKHLDILPLQDGRRILRASLLEGCTFKLETLRWGFESYDPGSDDPFVKFLGTQHELYHLEVGSEPSRQDLSWIPDDVCPSLISASCRLDSAAHMAARRNVVGLTLWSDWYSLEPVPQRDLSALRHLKYLSISAHRDLMSNWVAVDSNLVLLELTSGAYIEPKSLPILPKLRVVAFILAARGAPLATLPGHTNMDVKTEYRRRIQLAIDSFHRFPVLECVISEDMRRGNGPRLYRKMTISGIGAGPPGATLEVQSEEFPNEHELGLPWWTVYGV
ncbi:hypothetical protein D9619_004164 [Psilocybe cf. subviscida]|uniref:Uncharacterized protein n=1 Tax=Psilocybe cf. subviscida TaxID=2480587 RepID=A0A8H5F7R8_9AGAR|nr:hypothetical protein D9619_004164 [Psilocybe cf. subviscida]